MTARAFYTGGTWRESPNIRGVVNPFNEAVVSQVCQASAQDIEEAIASAGPAFQTMRGLSACERATILKAIADGIESRRDEFARLITLETGKPISLARSEVERSVFTFVVASEEATRIEGSMLPLDLNAQSVGRFGLVQRFPIGPIAAITPFNFPLNLVAHKVAPAFAVGNPVLLKPSSSAPSVALLLAEVASRTALPAGGLNVLPCLAGEAEQLVVDERIKLVSFTGSPAVGWPLKSRVGKKKVVLELGGNAGVIVGEDADLELAISKIVSGGFANAGQSCISVQRVFVHRSAFDEFNRRLMIAVQKIVVGDPFDERTLVGPMITQSAAMDAERWIAEAVSMGARVCCGGTRSGAVLSPTVLRDVPPEARVNCNEVFAPIVTVAVFDEFEEAIAQVNNSRYGLQAGLFTNDFHDILEAFRMLDVGGVVVNDVPTYRIDHMPYGGVKDSGFGREGIRYAMEEMTEMKLLAVNPSYNTSRPSSS
jgi:acyl-CoA reductase-like NAD-dependent aldehyde dehydrogenase